MPLPGNGPFTRPALLTSTEEAAPPVISERVEPPSVPVMAYCVALVPPRIPMSSIARLVKLIAAGARPTIDLSEIVTLGLAFTVAELSTDRSEKLLEVLL